MVETDSSPESTLHVVLLVRWSFLSLGSSHPCVLPIHRPFSPLGFPSILCDWPVDTLPAMLEVCFSDGRKWELTAGVPEMNSVPSPWTCLSAQMMSKFIIIIIKYLFISLFTYLFGSSCGYGISHSCKHILPQPHTHTQTFWTKPFSSHSKDLCPSCHSFHFNKHSSSV